MKINITFKKALALPLLPSAWRPWFVCLSANLFCFYQIIQSNMLNSLNASLLKTFSINATQMGYISASYFYANVLFLFIAGYLIDHISRRMILITACFINIFSIFCFSIAQAPWQLFVCHFVTGFAESFSLTACIRLATNWFPRKHLAAVIGLMGGVSGLGGIIAQAPFSFSVDHVGWRNTLVLDAILGVIILLLIILFVQDQAKISENEDEFSKITLKSLKKSFKDSAKNWQNWLIGIYAGLITLPMFLLAALWGNQYLVHVHEFKPQQAAWIISTMFIGSILGGPSLGWLSDHFRTRKIPMQIIAALGFILSLALIFNIFKATILLCMLFFLLGWVVSAQSLAYSVATEANPKNIISSAQGFVATLMMLAGFLQNLFSSLLQWGWQEQYKNDMPIYSLNNYQHAFMILPITFVIAFLVAYKLQAK